MRMNFNSIGLSIGLLFALSAFAGVVRADSTNASTKVPDRLGIVWGNVTNAISAGVQISHDYGQRHGSIWSPIQIDIYLKRSGDPLRLISTNGPIFWGATNSFCGPIELRGPDGRDVQLLQTNVSSSNRYPDSLSMKEMNEAFQRELLRYKAIFSFPVMPGSHGPAFLHDSNRPYLLKEFYLNDYFHLDRDIEYRLTVLPKIYRQSPTNEDLYQRIDIPAVTVPVRWNR